MGRPGTDTAFDTGQMKIGKRLAIKLLNASKFSLSLNATLNKAEVTQAVDHALLNKLAQVVETATTSFDKYDYTRALEVAETFFWAFTDDYVELVKERTYGNQGEAAASSARAALGITTHTLLKLFAPFIPFVTEDVAQVSITSGSPINPFGLFLCDSLNPTGASLCGSIGNCFSSGTII